MTPLAELIGERILQNGSITFAQFMELALYHPQHGYYTRAHAALGPDGDFVTASDSGRGFGRCLARQLAEFDDLLGCPDPFRYLEVGPGRGLLARDVIDALPEVRTGLHARIDPLLAERSATLRAACARTVPEARTVETPAEVGRGQGCVVAVELFDALPVHRLRRKAGRLLELRVALDADRKLIEEEHPPEPEAAELAESYGAAAADGTEAEVCTLLPETLSRICVPLERGFVVIVDYGDSADRLYARNPAGTLMAYREHRAGTDYLQHVGQQDLTAHVNFSALEAAAHRLDLVVCGRTTQDRFLLANGLADAFDPGDDRWSEPAAVKRRLQALQLIHPHAMGRRFQVLVLAKGLEVGTLDGLRDPFA